MKTIRQLLRQPVKSLLGIAVIALAVLLLDISMGQGIASSRTRQTVERAYSTIALTTNAYMKQVIYDEYGTASGVLWAHSQPQEIKDFIAALPEAHPELVREVASHGLASAYVPELVPINFTRYETAFSSSVPESSTPYPYSRAVLVISVTGISEPCHYQLLAYPEDIPQPLRVDITGRVESVVSLQEGFHDPTGYTARITLTVSDQAALDALELKTGGSYLIYSNNYKDMDYYARNNLFNSGSFLFVDSVNPNDIQYLTEEELDALRLRDPDSDAVACYSGPTKDGREATSFIAQFEIDFLRSCELSICDWSSLPQDTWKIRDSFTDGDVRYYTDRRMLKTADGISEVSKEEFQTLYGSPTIARLSGTVDEFLSSENGTIWRRALENIDICNHAFPILGVDSIGSMADFARGLARVTQGRDFTEREYHGGANVCIVSETLAQANGLAVGNVITLRYYEEDPNLNYLDNSTYNYISVATADPAPAFYSDASGFSSQTIEYTVVGLYRQSGEWNSYENPYSFTPNTIFVPKKSVRAEMHFSDTGVYQTIQLRNGKIAEFERAVKEAGYEDLFVCYDQGYSEIAENLDAYDSVSRTVSVIGVLAWAGVFLLFLFLFPARKKADARRMLSLGGTVKQARLHVFLSGAVLLIPGTIIGSVASMLLWNLITGKIMAAAKIALDLASVPWAIPLVSLSALAVSAALVYALSVPLCRQRGLS